MFGIADFSMAKKTARPIVMVSVYDAWSATLVEESKIDVLLVGDSAAMVMHGYPTTLYADMNMMSTHVSAVRRGAAKSFIVGDMPFLSTRKSLHDSVENAGILMRAGANAIKIEGLDGHQELIPKLIHSGIPVMGHIGLQPQQVEVLGSWKVQGKDSSNARRIMEEGRQLEALGCFALVVECVPPDLAKNLSRALTIPVIGIGAGAETDGQVLVLHDLLGFSRKKLPRFVRKFGDLADPIKKSLDDFVIAVHNHEFPSANESYGERQ
jgi:3-methyl-2-oxobutanoate hydroxymethyltransferase